MGRSAGEGRTAPLAPTLLLYSMGGSAAETCLLRVIEDRDPEVARLLHDLGPAEKRHWQMFYALAERELPAEQSSSSPAGAPGWNANAISRPGAV